ncbi:MAG: hypothetical protein ABIR58_06435 [Gemmatimonadaceae bacterium]
MATILVVGPDMALIEGLNQTFVAAGHRVTVAHDITEAIRALQGVRPLMAIVDRAELFADGTTFRVPLAPGGALVAFRPDESLRIALPFPVQRAMLASLKLPLERQRLVALVANVEARAKAAGRHDGIDVDDGRWQDTPSR